MPYSYGQGYYEHNFPDLKPFVVERNLLTFATSRTGKGATQIIPWLKENLTTNALVIDPKGEALEATLQEREQQRLVCALDPFRTTNIPESKQAKLNVLDFIDPNISSAFREINAVADGLVMRNDSKSDHWDGGGVEVLAGFIAHVLTHSDFEGRRSLVTVRQLLTAQGDIFNSVVEDMAHNNACGNLPATASSKLNNTGNEANHFISTAVSNTKWLDDPDIAECLSSSTFDLRNIKTHDMDVFLVLPVEALGDYGRFLRLFVRMALYHMQVKANGQLKVNDVFFILDEAFSLGYISEIENSMSSMPGFGLHIWTFWQDYNQILKRYDKKGTGTFFANSDVAYFYGVNDLDTATLVSNLGGVITENDIGVRPPLKHSFDSVNIAFREAEARYTNASNRYQIARNVIGKPRVPTDIVSKLTKRDPVEKIALNALAYREGKLYIHPLNAYFSSRKRQVPVRFEVEEENIYENWPDYVLEGWARVDQSRANFEQRKIEAESFIGRIKSIHWGWWFFLLFFIVVLGG